MGLLDAAGRSSCAAPAEHPYLAHADADAERREPAFAAPVTVAALLDTLGLDTRKVAVERNEEIVPRSRYAETWLASGDALEIVHFIGGG